LVIINNPPFDAAHRSYGGATHAEGGGQVHRDGFVPLLVGGFLRVAGMDDPGIVDQHIQPTEPVKRGIHQEVTSVFVGDIGGDELCPAAVGCDIRRYLGPARRVAPAEQHGSTRIAESSRHRRPDARRAARYQYRRTAEIHCPASCIFLFPAVKSYHPVILASGQVNPAWLALWTPGRTVICSAQVTNCR
jgi:hypothetical protein